MSGSGWNNLSANDLNTLTRARACYLEGEKAEAYEICQSIESTDDHQAAEVLHLQAMILLDQGQWQKALSLLYQAMALDPHWAPIRHQMARLQKQRNDLKAAISELMLAVSLAPDFAEAWLLLGTFWRELGNNDEAVRSFQNVKKLEPDNAVALSQLGSIRLQQGHAEEALALLSRAQALAPKDSDIQVEYACALWRTNEPAAKKIFENTLVVDPDHEVARANLGLIHWGQGEWLAARRCWEGVKRAEARLGLAMLDLAAGHYTQGFIGFESRFECYQKRPEIAAPLWRGEDLSGRHLLIVAEQGFGDCIHFLRFLPKLARDSYRLTFRCPSALHRLIQYNFPNINLIDDHEKAEDIDYWCPLLSLPLAMKWTEIPRLETYPYLQAPPLALTWPETKNRRIGLVWQGNKAHHNDFRRSIGLKMLSPWFDVPGLQWVSLQWPAPLEELPAPIGNPPELRDFADTACLLSQVDILISVDTAVAHVAGAMGLPLWLLLPLAGDWRWGLEGEHTPWYPSARLFRQNQPGNWQNVVNEVEQRLRDL